MQEDKLPSKKHVQVPNNMTQEAKLIPRDAAVYATIKKYVNYNTGETFVGLETIAQDCNLTVPTVRKSINALKDGGYITVTKKGRSNIYKFPNYKNFEPFSYEFLNKGNIDVAEKGYVVVIQQHLFKDMEGYGKTTYSNEQLAEILNISAKTIQRLDKSLMEKGYLTIVKTSAIDKTTGLKINEKIFYLNELEQSIIWTLQKHEDRINGHDDKFNTMEKQFETEINTMKEQFENKFNTMERQIKILLNENTVLKNEKDALKNSTNNEIIII